MTTAEIPISGAVSMMFVGTLAPSSQDGYRVSPRDLSEDDITPSPDDEHLISVDWSAV